VGGEAVREYTTADSGGFTDEVLGTFNLYTEQSIEFIATLTSDLSEQYPNQIFGIALATLTRDKVYPDHDFGDVMSYGWTLSINRYVS